MRIIEITGEPILHGGQEKFIANLISNLKDDSLIVDVLTPYNVDNDAFCETVHLRGGEVYSLELEFLPGKSRKLLLDPLTVFLKGKQYDVAHIHSGSISVLAYSALAAKRAGIEKVIVHSHSTGNPSIKHSIIRTLFGNTIKNNADYYLSCSYEAGRMKYSSEIVDNDLVIIQNGIDINQFAANETIRTKVRKSLDIPEEAFVIGHVGRFSEEKNHSFLINLFPVLMERIPEAKLLLVGDGELMNEIIELAHGMNIAGNVIFTGNVDEVTMYYQVMDIFVLPSVYEGLPFVALEAQAAGIPCLLSDGVSEDAVIGKNVERLSLADSDLWIESIAAYKGAERVDNSDALRKAGFDIVDTVNQIKRIYNN